MGHLYAGVEALLGDGHHDPLSVAWALAELSAMADAESKDTVREAVRVHRYHWTAVGKVFGITRQAAQKKYGHG